MHRNHPQTSPAEAADTEWLCFTTASLTQHTTGSPRTASRHLARRPSAACDPMRSLRASEHHGRGHAGAEAPSPSGQTLSSGLTRGLRPRHAQRRTRT